ncbi:hypothetical protein D3C83_45690 [compost metagenome]
MLEQHAQRRRPGARLQNAMAERRQDRLERDQVLGPVVDRQDLDRLCRHGWSHRSSASLTSSCARRSSGSTRGALVAATAAAGMIAHSAVAGSCTSATPPPAWMRASPAAPSALAPVRMTPAAAAP